MQRGQGRLSVPSTHGEKGGFQGKADALDGSKDPEEAALPTSLSRMGCSAALIFNVPCSHWQPYNQSSFPICPSKSHQFL